MAGFPLTLTSISHALFHNLPAIELDHSNTNFYGIPSNPHWLAAPVASRRRAGAVKTAYLKKNI